MLRGSERNAPSKDPTRRFRTRASKELTHAAVVHYCHHTARLRYRKRLRVVANHSSVLPSVVFTLLCRAWY